MAAAPAAPTGPNYAALTKGLTQTPNPLVKGPYLDQTGPVPNQATMSHDQFLGSLGPAWDEFSKSGGYLDKAYNGEAQILGDNGQPMSVQDITNAVTGAGKSFTANPFLNLPIQQNQLYQNTDRNVGDYYKQLVDSLNSGRQDYEQRSGDYAKAIGGYFDAAGRDVSQFGQGQLGANQQFANSIGLGGTTGAGTQSAALADQLSRLGAVNATNKANAQSTFDQRRGIIDDLLQQRALSAATQGAQSRDALAQMAQQHWGLADPNQLYQSFLANKSNVDLAKGQQDVQLAQLQAQLAGATAGAGGGGGKSGGGKGRSKGGSGGSSSSAAPSDLNPQDIIHDALVANPGPAGFALVDELKKRLYSTPGDPTNPASRTVVNYTSRVG